MQGDTVQLFSDGACKGNPGPGGWGAVLVTPAGKKTLFGGEPDTTNNRMELTAVIEGLRALPTASRVVITTDSQYVKNGMEQWIHGWKRNGWRTADKKPVKNADLWQALDAAIAGHQVSWRWVRGHTGHPENELADRLANRGVDQALRGGGAPDPEVEAEADPPATPAVFRADLRVHALAVSRDGVGTRLVLEATALPPGPAVRLRLDFGGAEALRLARPLELPWDLPGLEVVELAPADAGRPRYRVQSREVGGLSLTCRGFSRGDPDPPGR